MRLCLARHASSIHRWCRECRATTDTRVRKDASTLVTCVHLYSILLSYLFIVYLDPEQLHNRPIASLSPHQTSNMPPSNSTTSSSALPPSTALTICTPRLRLAVLQVPPLAHRRALSVLLTEFYSARLSNDLLRELADKSFSAPRHPRRALPGLHL